MVERQGGHTFYLGAFEMSSTRWILGAATPILAIGVIATIFFSSNWKEKTMASNVPATNTSGKVDAETKLETATFGAGCFWGVEAAFRQIKGVKSTAVGYLGGTMENPSYKDVCTGRTGHAEVVQVEFDPSQVTYEELLEVFWSNHNPTTLNRQGPDYGTQYRSAIFYHSPQQKTAAEATKEKHSASKRFRDPIVTEITPASEFYIAEDYHQQYLEKRGLSSCHM